MIEEAFIHEYGNGKLEPEHQEVMDVLRSRNIPVQLFTTKALNRRRLNLRKESLVVGEHPIVSKALKYLEIQEVKTDCYPSSIRKFLKRKIWNSTIRLLTDTIYQEQHREGVFVKPKTASKKFTGFVFDSPNKSYLFEGASKQTSIYCSEIVNWVSEYRVFVMNATIIGVKNYTGDPSKKLDMNEVMKCINTLETSDESTKAYGIDFGVLDSGETSLIEWNDGYALGSYGLNPELYTDLLIARWEELME